MGLTGFIGNVNQPTGINTTYTLSKVVRMTYNDNAATIDGRTTRPPKNLAEYSRLYLKFSSVTGTLSGVEATLTWDAAGNEIAAGPFSSSTPFTGMTGPSNPVLFGIGLDDWCPITPTDTGSTPPDFDAYPAGDFYLHLKLSGSTPTATLSGARLEWSQLGVQL